MKRRCHKHKEMDKNSKGYGSSFTQPRTHAKRKRVVGYQELLPTNFTRPPPIHHFDRICINWVLGPFKIMEGTVLKFEQKPCGKEWRIKRIKRKKIRKRF
ncbi:unnamed protein product [Cuscuta campestris]|uniref:Uncharacterized protein n=1 Tax=Cuscuta campestris TaxID=132261 RepID=A0A484LB94_9ASTE|nr:unnamed protein product [Cuscuta campestris]